MMKKKILALAVSGGLAAAPMGAMAKPEVYGIVDIGIEQFSNSDGIAAEIFPGAKSVGGNSDERDFALVNGLHSRLGVRGNEDLDVGGLTASYNIELGIDVLNDGSNDTFTRLGWAALGGDWGKIKVGSQWQALYEFGGWNTHRTDVHGYGTYYRTTSYLSNSQQYGFRQDSAISYEYGSAWGHSDPFAAQVTLGVGEGTATSGAGNTVQNEEGITSLQAAFQYSMAKQFSVNAVYATEFNSYRSNINYSGGTSAAALNQEPTLMNVGARWSVTDALELDVNYTTVDLDNAADDTVDSIAVASMMDFGNGLTGHLGFSQASDDTNAPDIDLNSYGYIKQALSDRTNVRLELENIQYDNAGDSSVTVALIGMQHNF
ncbi:porin [Halomonadaceae bacterium KBTZ08]